MTIDVSKGSIIVTGATGGLGSAIAFRIASGPLGKDYHGVYTVRKPDAAGSLKETLNRSPAHKHDLVALDLSSLANVRECAATINRRVADASLPPIRALILNAAFQDGSGLTMSDDGFDMTFQVNYLSNFLLTLLLLQSIDKEQGRILVIGSWSHE
jgi:NAD(P)-dependent dehydrogenase (short-subunit alcohol dehydrogenase family)